MGKALSARDPRRAKRSQDKQSFSQTARNQAVKGHIWMKLILVSPCSAPTSPDQVEKSFVEAKGVPNARAASPTWPNQDNCSSSSVPRNLNVESPRRTRSFPFGRCQVGTPRVQAVPSFAKAPRGRISPDHRPTEMSSALQDFEATAPSPVS